MAARDFGMSSSRIRKIEGRRVWDSRGRPTVEAEVFLEGGASGRAIAPAGASTGTGEALDLRDGGGKLGGADVSRAVAHVNGEIAAALHGRDVMDQAALDQALIELDGTPNKSRLGANALVAVSMAALHAAASSAGQPLYEYLLRGRDAIVPLPEIQIFGGGAHAGHSVDVQDFMVMAPAARSFDQALEWTAEIYRAARDMLSEAGRLHGRPGDRHLPRYRGIRVLSRRPLPSRPRRPRARQRRDGRHARPLDRPLSHLLDRRPPGGAGRRGAAAIHRCRRRPRAGRGR